MSLNPTLNDLIEQKSLKWIFVGGKGGVGKTTTSSSLAILLAERRESVLILSTDPAHNLSDAFSQKFTNSPSLVNGFNNLFAMEIDSDTNFKSMTTSSDAHTSFLSILPELIQTFPGVDEALSFAELMNSIRTMNYSVIVFDTAPTGHTLRLMGFPNLLEKSLTHLSSLREKLQGTFNMVQNFTGDFVNTEELNNKLDSLRALTASVKSTLQDPTKTTFISVCIPEFLSVYETERLVQELAKFQIDTSNIVVNQVLFPVETNAISLTREVLDELISAKTSTTFEDKLQNALILADKKINDLSSHILARRKMQSKYLQQIDDLYSYDFHVVPMPMQTEEVRGLVKLRNFGKLLLEERQIPIVE